MKKLTSYLLFVACLAPTAVFGLGTRVPDQDPLATARGNAFTATADNPSAIYYNPAGITQVEETSMRSGIYGITLGSEFTKPGGGSYHTTRTYQGVPQLYFTTPIKDTPVTFGFGAYSPFGLALEWPDSRTGFDNLARKGEITYLAFNPVLAWKVNSKLSLAIGPTINYAKTDLSRGVAGPTTEIRFRGDDTAPGFNVGILYQPIQELSFGANYRSETDMGFRGRTTFIGVPAPPFANQNSSAEFVFPQSLAVGVSYRPTPDWNIEADIDWTDWDRLNNVTLQQAAFPGNLVLPFNWRSSFFYEFGVTRRLGDSWTVSGGYIFSENSIPDASFNPIVPDSDRHIFSIGVGRSYKKFSWDAAYQFAYGPERTVNAPAPVGGKYEFFSHALTITIGYHF